MSIPPDVATGPLQAWLDITESAGASTGEPREDAARVSRRLLALTAAATIAALTIAMVATRTTTAPPSSPAATLAPAAAAATSPMATAPPADHLAVAAAAVSTVRLQSSRDLYVDTAVAERVRPAGATTIVSVRAVVLPRTPQGWGAPRTARYAVAIQDLDGTPSAVGGPWLLPNPDAAPAPAPRWRAAADLTTAAATALRSAGYRDVSAVTPRRSTDLDGILSVLCRAVGPGESSPRRHDVWLTSDAAHVLGAARSTAAPPVPMEQP